MKLELTGDVYGVGDIHGETRILEYFLDFYNLRNCTLILLGDIGIFRYRDYKHYLQFDKFCKEREIIAYAFRGNHDNPAFFLSPEEQSPIARRFWEKFTNFKVLPDLTRVVINGNNGIVIGGGVSIDRCCRKTWLSSYRQYGNLYKSNDWWEGETVPNTDGIEEKFDFILSHTGPRPVKIPPLSDNNCSFFKQDTCLKDDINAENKRLEEIQHQFKPTRWWFGHFHINDDFEYFDTRCTAVDINFLTPLQL